MNAPIPITPGGFDRSGHPSELALDRHLYGEADEGARRRVDEHLATCRACAEIVAGLRAEDAALAIPLPPPRVRAITPPRPGRIARLGAFVKPLGALAAAVLLAVGVSGRPGSAPIDAPDAFRARGSTLGLSVHVHDGDHSRLVDTGASVRAGDRARFEVIVAEDGFLLVAGIDDRGELYAGYPQEDGAAAVFVRRSHLPRALPTAIEFDASQGTEHLFAMLCEAPFGLELMRAAMAASLGSERGVAPPPGCTLRRVDLTKSSQP